MRVGAFPLSTTNSSNPLIRSKHALDPWVNALFFLELICRLIRTNGGDSNIPLSATAIRTLLWSVLVVKLAWRVLCQHPAMWWTLDFFPPGSVLLDRCWSCVLNGTDRCLHHMVMLGEWFALCRALVSTMAYNHGTELWSTLTTWLQGRRVQEQSHNEYDNDVDNESMKLPWSNEQNWTNYSQDSRLTRSKAPQDKHV